MITPTNNKLHCYVVMYTIANDIALTYCDREKMRGGWEGERERETTCLARIEGEGERFMLPSTMKRL